MLITHETLCIGCLFVSPKQFGQLATHIQTSPVHLCEVLADGEELGDVGHRDDGGGGGLVAQSQLHQVTARAALGHRGGEVGTRAATLTRPQSRPVGCHVQCTAVEEQTLIFPLLLCVC